MDKDVVFLEKLRSNLIGGIREIERELSMPSSLMTRDERKLINYLRDNDVHPLVMLDLAKVDVTTAK